MSPTDWTANTTSTTAAGSATAAGPSKPTLWTRLAFFALRRLQRGSLTVVLPDGRRFEFAGPHTGPRAEVHLSDQSAVKRLLLGGDLGFAESYMDGHCESPDLTSLIELCARNRDDISRAIDGHWLGRAARRIGHFHRRNSKTGSQRNISHHYDIGNAFYAHWLDPTMTYSSAIFSAPDEDLEAAQMRKYRRLADQLDLHPGQTVLEIGCGWGGFARLLARDYGVKVVGITLSTEQRDEALKRIAAENLSDRIEIRLQDYRDVSETYDRIASIEMLEAVGEAYWPTYFATLRDRLTPDGRAALQVITIDDAIYESYRANPDFIQKYIFPGGMLPSPSKLVSRFAQANLTAIADDGFGLDYARTLAVWRSRFLEAWPAILEQGFDERFRRMWLYYLAYCEGGFLAGHIDVRQIVLKHA
ncbi:MAG: cyclopropane-fatty-acyl-phospholipid synthase [Proteobacteria bacterium]|nr:cyclopropane-fatty-acyl-phospholipid synthase [Pseudomonadota bacterium]